MAAAVAVAAIAVTTLIADSNMEFLVRLVNLPPFLLARRSEACFQYV